MEISCLASGSSDIFVRVGDPLKSQSVAMGIFVWGRIDGLGFWGPRSARQYLLLW